MTYGSNMTFMLVSGFCLLLTATGILKQTLDKEVHHEFIVIEDSIL